MTYEYTLADKLKNQFSGRGASLSGMQASSTSELMRRAEMGRDPKVNCAEQAFREQYNSRSNRNGNVRREYSESETMYTAVYSTCSQRNASGKRRTDNARRAGANNGKVGAKNTASRNGTRTQQKNDRRDRIEPIIPSLEVPVKKRFIPPVFVAMLLVSTLMIMFLVMSISEIYETTNEIADLENEIATLKSDAEDLKLQLEEKNDIRLIEKIATEQLGMTKEDSLQRRYVSLSDGERIDILESETEEESGVLLSSVFSAIGDLFDGN